ncbi:negative regulator of flagellin synthesis FlgM [Desulfitispora alkaliphila]|uniref:flagellar biosynthesis anti-sigma factor FlgM n=1 Tax=Desulfitispora alkaliphila TaxID=622674 RepID=UPI003D1FE5C8
MKITHPHLNSMLNSYKKTAVEGKKNQQQSTGVQKRDKSMISQQGKLYQTAAKALKETSQVREERVEAVKKQVEAGTYNVSGKEIAEKIMTKGIDELI